MGVGSVFYVLLNALLCAGLVWCPYQFLVEVTMLLMVIMTYPFLFAFVLLRISQPDVPRPFKVPGGTIAAVLWTLPPGLLGTAYLCQCHNPVPNQTRLTPTAAATRRLYVRDCGPQLRHPLLQHPLLRGDGLARAGGAAGPATGPELEACARRPARIAIIIRTFDLQS